MEDLLTVVDFANISKNEEEMPIEQRAGRGEQPSGKISEEQKNQLLADIIRLYQSQNVRSDISEKIAQDATARYLRMITAYSIDCSNLNSPEILLEIASKLQAESKLYDQADPRKATVSARATSLRLLVDKLLKLSNT